MHTHNFVILHTENCEAIIVDKKSNEHIHIKANTLVAIEKHVVFNLYVKRTSDGNLCNYLWISDRVVSQIKSIFELLHQHNDHNDIVRNYLVRRTLNEKVFIISKNAPCDVEIFSKIVNLPRESGGDKLVYDVTYLLSKIKDSVSLIASLASSTSVRFSDLIKDIIMKDLTKRWRLSDISRIVNLSEVAIRKKLDKESTTFNEIILNLRMSEAMKYLVRGGCRINTISGLVGYSSVSYFIRAFKGYYGITPKKFIIGMTDKYSDN